MPFAKSFIPTTSDDTKDLVITDTSVYDSSNPKTSFTNRVITITKSDNTFTTYQFPYTNTDNSIKDQFAISNYFDKDYALIVTVVWYQSSTNTSTTTNYLGFKKAFNNKKKLFISLVCGECNCGCAEDELKNKLDFYKADSLIQAAKDSIGIQDFVQAQRNLDWLNTFFINI